MDGLRQEGDDVLVFVRAKPRASRSKVLGAKVGEIEVALCAPPVDGAANNELIRLMSKTLGVSKSRVHLERGETSRHKVVRVEGLPLDTVRQLLGG